MQNNETAFFHPMEIAFKEMQQTYADNLKGKEDRIADLEEALELLLSGVTE